MNKAYQHGYEDALLRGTPIPHIAQEIVNRLERENVLKAQKALEDAWASPAVKAYWFGYLAALLRNN